MNESDSFLDMGIKQYMLFNILSEMSRLPSENVPVFSPTNTYIRE